MIKWVPVSERVPDNWREVLVWGVSSLAALSCQPRFLGMSRCNVSADGHKFDIEGGMLLTYRVTHWADIKEPRE